MSHLVGNPEDRFSSVEAHIRMGKVAREKHRIDVNHTNLPPNNSGSSAVPFLRLFIYLFIYLFIIRPRRYFCGDMFYVLEF